MLAEIQRVYKGRELFDISFSLQGELAIGGIRYIINII
jgi:hypothetical protein